MTFLAIHGANVTTIGTRIATTTDFARGDCPRRNSTTIITNSAIATTINAINLQVTAVTPSSSAIFNAPEFSAGERDSNIIRKHSDTHTKLSTIAGGSVASPLMLLPNPQARHNGNNAAS